MCCRSGSGLVALRRARGGLVFWELLVREAGHEAERPGADLVVASGGGQLDESFEDVLDQVAVENVSVEDAEEHDKGVVAQKDKLDHLQDRLLEAAQRGVVQEERQEELLEEQFGRVGEL